MDGKRNSRIEQQQKKTYLKNQQKLDHGKLLINKNLAKKEKLKKKEVITEDYDSEKEVVMMPPTPKASIWYQSSTNAVQPHWA